MLREVMWLEGGLYTTESDNEPIQFYLDGLCIGYNFDPLLGYLSSGVIKDIYYNLSRI